ncbi:hypothetical protein PQ460_17425 [Paenibacillus sp. KACC 21273]|uniref:hypothetical protein n=1 Tax=Paenibacillus sp. KACC 21273 TaxID=3025665 RepID=UPI002366D7CC|nr:hypothetical protein [Paenibacillus sp. KACC 21273]WDF49769.1 hypothetical protein PQ460_17425 [Paenibacillus sp. KACC 21273]
MLNTEKSLEIMLEPLIRKRLEVLYSDLQEAESTYVSLRDECDKQFSVMRNSLPDHLQHNAFMYEDVQLELQAIVESRIYLQGFKDAIELFSELNIYK